MLTRKDEQTIRIVQYLASPENFKEGSTAMIILNELGTPSILLRGILRRLAQAGIVNSRRGRTGGVTLAEKALKLSVLDVLNAVNAGIAAVGRKKPGPFKPEPPKKDNDPVCALFQKAQAKVNEFFEGVTVAQLVAFEK